MTNGVFTSNNPSIPAVSATGTDGASGIDASSDTGTAVSAQNFTSGSAVSAIANADGTGVTAQSDTGTGVVTQGIQGIGLWAIGPGAIPVTPPISQAAIFAQSGLGTTCILATSDNGVAVEATAQGSTAVSATSNSGTALSAISDRGVGVIANGGGEAPGVTATADSGTGVEARSNTGAGVTGESVTNTGVAGITGTGIGVSADGGSAGVALRVIGKVQVQGNSVGSVTLAAGTKTLTVTNGAATADSLILLTPLDDPRASLWIGARSAGSFTIEASKALPAAVTIAFLIVN